MNNYFSTINWDELFDFENDYDVNSSFSKFYDTLYDGFNQFVPLMKTNSFKHLKWYDKKLLHLKNMKSKAHKRIKSSGSSVDCARYISLRREFDIYQKYLYDKHIVDIESNIMEDPSSFWKFINSKKINGGIPSNTFFENETANNVGDAANLFAKHFQSVY